MQKENTHLDKAPLAELRLAVLADWVQDDDILTVGQGGDVDNTDNLNTMTSQWHHNDMQLTLARKQWFSISSIETTTSTLTTTLDKKKNHFRDSRWEERCSIVWYHARWCTISAGQKSRTESRMTLPCADRSSSQDRTVFFSPQISRMVLFFFVQGSMFMNSKRLLASSLWLQRERPQHVKKQSHTCIGTCLV